MTDLQIDGYEIMRKLGQGGMAQVYLAREISLDREVAIKVLPAYLVEREDLRKRFRREAKTIAKLAHRSIVPVYDYGEGNKGPYLSMRYMQGGSLADKLENGQLSLSDAVKIIDRLADGLDKAHKNGVIHRDLKPGNILFDDDGMAYLADFGIVKLTNPDTSITPTDGLVGTPSYMSPEQVEGEAKIDGRSDIYALGVILFEMLTGALPYQAATPYKLAMKHVFAPLPLILQVNPSLPAACDAIIKKAMAKKPKARYQTAQAMVDDLKQAVSAVGATKTNPGLGAGVRPPNRKPVWFGAVAVILLVLGFAVYGLVMRADPIATIPATAVSETVPTLQPTDEPPPAATTAVATTAVPAVPTETLLPATPVPTETAVPATATSSPTDIPTASPLIVQLETTTTNVNLYGGPSGDNPVLGLLVRGVVVEAIGKVDNDSWYEVKTEAGKEGWLNAEQVAFVAGTTADVPITWPRSASAAESPAAESPATTTPVVTLPDNCSGVAVVRDDLGNYHLHWDSYPAETHHLWLSVVGAESGDPLVYPNDIDQNDPDWEDNGFTIGKWVFADRGFAQNTTYQYVLKAMDASGAEICSVSGSFVN